MRILKFKGTKVHDYLTFDIDFNKDLSILTGVNGSGKTTAILLLQAILCPNFRDLVSIPFESLLLTVERNQVEINISVVHSNNKVILSINPNYPTLELEKSWFEEFEFMSIKHKENFEVNDVMLKRLSPHPVIDFIKDLPSPIFIGLERRSDEAMGSNEDFLLERRILSNKSRQEFSQYKRQFKGTLGVSLLETEFLVQSMYKKMKRIEEGYTAAIQKQILMSYFEYIPFDPDKDLDKMTDMINGRRDLLSRKQEIMEALKKIGYDDNAFTSKFEPLFDKLGTLIDKMAKDDQNKNFATIEWLVNKSQIEKLSQLVEIIDDFNSKINKAFQPIRKFTDIINSFLKDTGKSISIDPVGHLIIKRPNGKRVSIDALSSGERQIVILFGNVMFNKFTSEGSENILIIDEPELSLHIRWQERFINMLMKASEKTQFILATHSPDIVGEYKKHNVKLNK
ncbi:hypothetical protein D3C87_14550 [compost metagenome]